MNKQISEELQEKFKRIKLLALDFDGVLTVGGFVFFGQDSTEYVQCSRKDSLGINMLQKNGIKVHVISKEANPVVSARCKKMDIECNQAVEDSEGKAEILKHIAKDLNLSMDEVAYMGDDINDQAPLELAGLAISVADGHPLLKSFVDYVTDAEGGRHAVREISEIILKSKELLIK